MFQRSELDNNDCQLGDQKGLPVVLEDCKRISESQKLKKSRENHRLLT
jgi:hypothetical protein